MKYFLKCYLFFVFNLTFVLDGWAQAPYSACFTPVAKRGCAPFTVNVTSCSASGPLVGQPNPTYVYDFVNAPGITTQVTSNTYVNPGIYIIQQTVNDGVGFTNSVKDTIEVLGKPDPIYSAAACAGLNARVVITDTNYDTFTINYGDGTIISVVSGTYNHTYAATGNFTITVTGNYSIACTGASLSSTITTFVSLTTPDIIDLTVTGLSLTNGTLDLRYGGIASRTYSLESKINNGAYAVLQTFTAATTGSNTISVSSLNTQNNTYTLRLRNTDGCGNGSSYSTQIASILLNTSVLNGSIQQTFSSIGGLSFSTFDLNRAGVLYQANVTSPNIDNAVICGTDYCYQIVGTLPTISSTVGLNHKSYSFTACAKASYSGVVPTLSQVNSTVEGASVKIVCEVPVLNSASAPVQLYSLQKNNGGTFQNYASSATNNFIDNQVNVNDNVYCYKINYKDPCNSSVNAPLSNETCTILLTSSKVDEETNTLNWTSYIGYLSGVKEYWIESLDENGNVVSFKSVGLVNTSNEKIDPSLSQVIYRIKAIPNAIENLESVSNTIQIDLTAQIFLPTVFTPNFDGDNDAFMVKGKYFNKMTMKIFNKWGETIFIGTDPEKGWDGMYKGNPVPIDAYAYKVIIVDNKGIEKTYDGIVSLVR